MQIFVLALVWEIFLGQSSAKFYWIKYLKLKACEFPTNPFKQWRLFVHLIIDQTKTSVRPSARMPETMYECSDCQDSLYGQRYILRDDDMYCIKCYETHFSHQCELCQQLIGCTSKVATHPADDTTSRLASQCQPQLSLDNSVFLRSLHAS